MTTTTDYGHTHRQQRARWQPVIDAGHGSCHEIVCLEPTRTIWPGTPWDLAHDRLNGGYLGPAHPRCNRSEGATFGNKQRGRAKLPRTFKRWKL